MPGYKRRDFMKLPEEEQLVLRKTEEFNGTSNRYRGLRLSACSV